ncbi:MAG: alpha/beta fold hydrolase [Pirellulales bacterium]
MRMHIAVWLILTLFVVTAGAQAGELPEHGSDGTDEDMLNWQMKTFGGKQLWTDVRFFHGWHIQRHALTGHYRLLDGEQRRLAWGSFDDCEAALAKIKQEQPAMQGKAVILLHGLFRTKGAMKGMERFLAEQGGYTVFRMGYPSTRDDIDAHAEALRAIIDHLDGVTQIDLVGHSLGNLVIRRYLAITTDPERGIQGDRRLGRVVMLAPPNHGSAFGEKVLPLDVTKQIAGKSALAIAEDWKALNDKLTTPRIPFGILAGGKGDDEGYNRLIPGDDDMVVEVSSTRLAGAADFRIVPAVHTFIMNNEQVQRMTLHFLQHGAFEADQPRQPIAVKEALQAND